MNGIPLDSNTYKLLFEKEFKPIHKSSEFKSQVEANNYGGYSLIASETIPAGTTVQVFEGPIVEYEECTDYDKKYVLLHSSSSSSSSSNTANTNITWKYLLPLSDARYSNHSCNPNCELVGNDLKLVTKVKVEKGEELTFIYNNGTESDEWDHLWTFK